LTPPGRVEDLSDLIRRVVGGDQSALTALYDATSRWIYGLVLRIVGDQAAAEEVVLDVYTQVWRQAAAYQSERGSPLGWLATIARTRAIDRFRSGRQFEERRKPLDAASGEASGGQTPEEASVTEERQRLVRSALRELGPDQRQAIELAYFAGLSHSEIAAETGQPLGTVKTRVRLGMARLSELLAPLSQGGGA
jgi:RNA polymerase sigma-70 factor (ECF subfamily)